jgi:hypothetical protein
MEIKESIQTIYSQIKTTIGVIDEFSPPPVTSTDEFYKLVEQTGELLKETSKPLYEIVYQVTNILEDNIRSVYILTDDATLEGHATELETHLQQLRAVCDSIGTLLTTFNDGISDVIVKFTDVFHTHVKTESLLGRDLPTDTHPIMKIVLFEGGYRIVVDTLLTYKETCIKLLSILAITLGRWENKIEDRVDQESFQDSMVMANFQKLDGFSSKKPKRRSGTYL